MISTALENEFKGKKVKTSNGQEHVVIGAYVTDNAGLILVVITNENGKAMLGSLRVMGGLEVIP